LCCDHPQKLVVRHKGGGKMELVLEPYKRNTAPPHKQGERGKVLSVGSRWVLRSESQTLSTVLELSGQELLIKPEGEDPKPQRISLCLQVGSPLPEGPYREVIVREQTEDIKSMANWLKENKCEKIAMESTASYWKPLVNIFEITNLKYTVINARDYKNVPGKKTDVMDAEWIADLLQHGLLKDSYIPTREQRELREATRYRKSLTEERSRELNITKNVRRSKYKNNDNFIRCYGCYK